MGNCQSGASTGMSAPKELNPMDANPAELLNLGPDAEAFFAKGGKSYYDDVSSMNTARHLHPLCPPSIREISHRGARTRPPIPRFHPPRSTHKITPYTT